MTDAPQHPPHAVHEHFVPEASHHADVGAAPAVRPMGGRRMAVIGLSIIAVLVVLLVVTILPRRSVQRELLAEAAGRDSAPVVQVATVHRAAAGSELVLPGTIQALHESAIYARVSGYVKRWTADMGSLVKGGQTLAEIDAPELEQQVQQANAQRAQVRAALGLARADLERWRSLALDSAVTGQELDQKNAAYAAAVANVEAADANVRRLVQAREYTRVTAPFTGVVTARNIDLGSLITPAGATSAAVAGGGAGGSMYRIAQTDTVRTYVTVPEAYATSISAGLEARVTVQGIPGRTFTGRVARTSQSLDAVSRTLLVEIDVANRDFALLPGMFAQATLTFPRVTPPLLLPSAALLIRSSGTQVVVVEQGAAGQPATLHFRPVRVGRDYGATVEIADGLSDGVTVVMNPSADLMDGGRVRVLANPASGDAPRGHVGATS